MTQRVTGVTLTVQKAMGILDCLGEGRVPLSAAEIGRKLGIPRATAYRLLTTLASGGYVAQDLAKPERYRLGFRIVEHARGLLDSIELRREAAPFLQDLRDIANETIHLVVMDRGQCVYIDKLDCSQAVRMHSAIGNRVFSHCTAVGKALLAFMPKEEVERIIGEQGLPARTANTITEKDALFRELEAVRQRGYAVDNVENEEGIRCVAAAVLDHRGEPVAAVSVSGPAFRLTLEALQELIEPVRTTAFKISRRLGYPGERTGDA